MSRGPNHWPRCPQLNMESRFIKSKKILYSFIDRMDQKSWQDDVGVCVKTEVRRWLGERCASMEDIDAITQNMGLTDSQHQEFVRLVREQISFQDAGQESVLSSSGKDPDSRSFSLMGYAKSCHRLSCEESAEEVEIFQAGEAAKAKLDIEKNTLRYAEKCELNDVISRGRDAQERLIMGNWGLIMSLVKRYGNMGVSGEDLAQEGILGLIRAMQSYVPGKAAFPTYAICWVRKYILNAITAQGRQIPLSQNTAYTLSKIKKATADYEAKMGQTPTNEDISRATGLSARTVSNALYNERQSQSFSVEALSNDLDESHELLETIPDPQAEEEIEKVLEQVQGYDIKKLLHTILTPTERQVIVARFGFDGEQMKTLAELGTILGYTKENVRQIQKKAVAKLREAVR